MYLVSRNVKRVCFTFRTGIKSGCEPPCIGSKYGSSSIAESVFYPWLLSPSLRFIVFKQRRSKVESEEDRQHFSLQSYERATIERRGWNKSGWQEEIDWVLDTMKYE